MKGRLSNIRTNLIFAVQHTYLCKCVLLVTLLEPQNMYKKYLCNVCHYLPTNGKNAFYIKSR